MTAFPSTPNQRVLRPLVGSAFALVAAFGVGCALPTSEIEDVEEAQSAIENYNGLNLNGLNLNGLNLNGLNLNGLNLNGLNLNGLNPSAMNTLTTSGTTSAAAREVLRYMAGCALQAGQSFAFSWTDAIGTVHNESYPGLIGLAPEWGTGPLNTEGQEWVSACVASRTNYYGVAVSISSRGSTPALLNGQSTNGAERATYDHLEGAFWGNLFGAAPYLRSCFKSSNVEHSRSSLRECAAGHVNYDGTTGGCGTIERMGTCLDENDKGTSWTPCNALTSGEYYKGCLTPNGTETDRVVTTWLQ